MAWLGGLLPVLGAVDLRPGALYREVALIAWHFHWPRAECLGMSRKERATWLSEIDRINREIAKATKAGRRR